jgi:hypothetical protein
MTWCLKMPVPRSGKRGPARQSSSVTQSASRREVAERRGGPIVGEHVDHGISGAKGSRQVSGVRPAAQGPRVYALASYRLCPPGTSGDRAFGGSSQRITCSRRMGQAANRRSGRSQSTAPSPGLPVLAADGARSGQNEYGCNAACRLHRGAKKNRPPRPDCWRSPAGRDAPSPRARLHYRDPAPISPFRGGRQRAALRQSRPQPSSTAGNTCLRPPPCSPLLGP